MSENQVVKSQTQAAVDTPPAPMLTPEQFVEELRALMARVPDLPSLTRQERRLLQMHKRVADSEAQAAINVVHASDKVAHVVGAPTDDIRRVIEDGSRWALAENELKGALQSVADANLVRRQRVAAFTVQAYGIGSQLVRDPENSDLVPHVAEIKRLKASRRRKKAAPSAPAPATPTAQTP